MSATQRYPAMAEDSMLLLHGEFGYEKSFEIAFREEQTGRHAFLPKQFIYMAKEIHDPHIIIPKWLARQCGWLHVAVPYECRAFERNNSKLDIYDPVGSRLAVTGTIEPDLHNKRIVFRPDQAACMQGVAPAVTLPLSGYDCEITWEEVGQLSHALIRIDHQLARKVGLLSSSTLPTKNDATGEKDLP